MADAFSDNPDALSDNFARSSLSSDAYKAAAEKRSRDRKLVRIDHCIAIAEPEHLQALSFLIYNLGSKDSRTREKRLRRALQDLAAGRRVKDKQVRERLQALRNEAAESLSPVPESEDWTSGPCKAERLMALVTAKSGGAVVDDDLINDTVSDAWGEADEEAQSGGEDSDDDTKMGGDGSDQGTEKGENDDDGGTEKGENGSDVAVGDVGDGDDGMEKGRKVLYVSAEEMREMIEGKDVSNEEIEEVDGEDEDDAGEQRPRGPGPYMWYDPEAVGVQRAEESDDEEEFDDDGKEFEGFPDEDVPMEG